MSEAFLTSPKLGEQGRELFEQKFAQGDQVVTSLMRVDTTLRKARRNATEEDFSQLEALTESHLAKALEAAPYEKGVDITDYFHLRIKHVLIKQLVYAHSAFSERSKFELRRELVDGVYAYVAEVLEEALAMYDNATSDTDRERLTGAINELTALALLNRRQAPERLAVPSDVTADLYNATDLEYYTLTKGKEEPTIYHIQVKTSSKNTKKVHMPLGGILVTEATMVNARSNTEIFPTSRAIVADVNATDTSEQELHLQAALYHFEEHMRSETAKTDKVYEVMKSMPQDILHEAMSAIHSVIKRAFEENPDATQIIFELPEDS